MEDGEKNKLFVGGISWETTDDVLRNHFGKYGTVLGSVVAKNRETGSPRGFAFVTLSDSSVVDRALQDSHLILSRTVEVKRAIARGEQQSQQQQFRGSSRTDSRTNSRTNYQFRTKKIFVGGLSANLSEEEFRSYFEKFGSISDVVVMHDNVTRRPRGFGFITFDSEDSVEEVMQKNFHVLTGKLVEVKRAVPKDGSSSGNRYNGRLDGGKSPDFNSYQQESNGPYDTRFGYLPTGYGNISGYPYGPGLFGGVYPSGGYGGIGYGLTPIVPRSPWGPPVVGVRSSFLPYGSVAPFYPTYFNGVPGVMGLAVNGYGGDPQSADESMFSETRKNNVHANSSEQSQKGNDKAYPTTTNSS